MQIAITAAEFTPDEADGLRRAMATFRHNGNVHLYREQFIQRMTARGYDPTFVESCFGQIEGFGEYGFPESHAASFALLVYASAWLKCHYPDVFLAAILNSLPMGFYQPAQLVRDARDHEVEVRAADVNFSAWDCTLEPASEGPHRFAVRLGFRQIDGMSTTDAERIVATRGNGYASLERFAAVSGLPRASVERLAAADALRSLGLDRRGGLWAARRLDSIGLAGVHAATRSKAVPAPDAASLPLFARHMSDEIFTEPEVALPSMPLAEHVAEDYVTTSLSLKAHPVSFFRERLEKRRVISSEILQDQERTRHDQRISVAGLVLTRQMPGGKKVVFLTLEDETGIVNIIVWPKIFAANRRTVMSARFLGVKGRVQRTGLVIHVLAESFFDLSGELALLRDPDRIALSDSSPHRACSETGTPAGDTALPLKSRDFH